MSNRLPADSHTARRLEHATPGHLHHTTRRTFIGPIPEGWLKSHRKSWYRGYIRSGSSRAPTFTAAHAVSAGDEPDAEAQASGAATGLLEVPPRPSRHSGETRNTQEESTTGDQTTSTTSLLHSHREDTPEADARRESHEQTIPEDAPTSPAQHDGGNQSRPTDRIDRATSHGLHPRVRFTEATRIQLRERAQRLASKGGNFRSSKAKPGELLKMDKMLVRIDFTQQSIGVDFDEKLSQGVETKSLDKWREFMVVCREREGGGGVLQFYQTRVIANMADKTKKKPKVEIDILPGGRGGRVNMFSSLDKTLCVWTTEMGKTRVYYLRPPSGATSVEWFTFLQTMLGQKRAQWLQVNVPDLNVSLKLDDPFQALETAKKLNEAAAGNDEALAQAMNEERGAAGAIVTRCVDMLKQTPEWCDILNVWAEKERIGLAWKRYDRLEWVHGAVEQRMYGTIAMQKTHDLELRPKNHYPQTAKDHGEKVELGEPPPVEGFLIRLTSQRGQSKRFGKVLFKRLYFTTQNQYIIFVRPARATPPPPPKLDVQGKDNLPSTKQLVEDVPLLYDVEPYPLNKDGNVSWLDPESVGPAADVTAHDADATKEAERNTNMLLGCDGFINMSDITHVRKMQRGAHEVDEDLDSGTDVDFHQSVRDRPGADGKTSELDDDRTFELLLKNGLVIRLQAYSKKTKNEWITRLRALVKYWHHRAKEDVNLYKTVREQNLQALQIDERAEAAVGSFAYKWEVQQSYASPTMYNLCGIASCRPIHLSGQLFRKPRRHTTFTRCHVVLSAGHLLIFQDTLRKRTGTKLVHIHHERIGSIDLAGSYLYSGLLTENDLLYQNQTFDSNQPGHHALPRIYLEDQWTSTDEDAMTTFVIWHAKSKSWFRSSHFVDDVRTAERQNSHVGSNFGLPGHTSNAGNVEQQHEVEQGARDKTKTRLERVSKLGTTGRSVVFKARSRAERDHWVLGIQVEIERLAALAAERGDEGVRLVDGEGNAKK